LRFTVTFLGRFAIAPPLRLVFPSAFDIALPIAVTWSLARFLVAGAFPSLASAAALTLLAGTLVAVTSMTSLAATSFFTSAPLLASPSRPLAIAVAFAAPSTASTPTATLATIALATLISLASRRALALLFHGATF
jgi:hypothetical protein